MAVIADGGGATQIAVWPDLAVLADDDVTFDDYAGKNFGTFTYVDVSINVSSWADVTLNVIAV